MSNYLDSINKVESTMKNVSNDLSRIADALFIAGNDNLAMRLSDLSLELNDSAKCLDDAVSANISDMYKNATQSTDNMIAAALAAHSINDNRNTVG